MQLSILTLQGVTFFIVLVIAMGIMLYNYGGWIIKDLMNKRREDLISSEQKMKVDNYFTSKGYLVWDIRQEEKTKRWNVFLVKNKTIIEAKGFSISEIEKYAESLI